MPWVTSGTERPSVQRSRLARWLDEGLKHTTAIAAILSAVAYGVGYLLVVRYSDALGVPASSFGLEFRDYVLLSIASLGLVLIGVIVFAMDAWLLWWYWRRGAPKDWGYERKSTNTRTTTGNWLRTLVIFLGYFVVTSAVLFGPLAITVWLLFAATGDWREVGAGAEINFGILALAYALLGLIAALLVNWTLVPDWRAATPNVSRSDSSPASLARMRNLDRILRLWEEPILRALELFFKFFRILVILFVLAFFSLALALAVWWLPALLSQDAATSIRAGLPARTSTALDLVIRPKEVVVTERDGVSDLATLSLDSGDTIILISDRAGQAVIADPVSGRVVVTSSTDLSFAAPSNWEPFLRSRWSFDLEDCQVGDYDFSDEAAAIEKVKADVAETTDDSVISSLRTSAGIPTSVSDDAILTVYADALVAYCTDP